MLPCNGVYIGRPIYERSEYPTAGRAKGTASGMGGVPGGVVHNEVSCTFQ